ncbi:hypothetical protein KW868_09880 [Acinetobacter guillouiae]|uniref:Uncharacterized protein n=1 Tax=Acinetobacter guillouiae TaxID=106649 RepID=A0A8X8GDD1_ACIGI|nr:hypothetical protein [Acinetobacter guillouiae]MCF0264773.1 hypothetical protein [Acinetobacter guillouiae]
MQEIKKNFGLIVICITTIIYLIFITYLIFESKEFSKLSLNEIGDFLAGGFAPLAFLWLVYGYLQQGEELKQNTKALNMQAEELRISNETLQQQVKEMSKSVKTQQDMFALAEKQFESVLREKEYQVSPRLSLSGYKLSKNIINSNITNVFTADLKNLNIPIKIITITSSVWNMVINTTYENRHILKISEMNPSQNIQIRFYTLPNQNNHIFDNDVIKIEFSDLENNKYSYSYILEEQDVFVIFKRIEEN